MAEEAIPGSTFESYLRLLQLAGGVPLEPWSLRPFSRSQLERLAPSDSGHPWANRLTFLPSKGLRTLRPYARTQYNTGFAFGVNDGATWAGRGATVTLSGGVSGRWGPISARLEPEFYWTQNQSYEILDNGRTGQMRFADGQYPASVDYPQRFGDRSFGRLDAGASELRLDAFGVSAGFSNAHSWWGPAEHFPFLLGTNAPGFPHLFIGSERPVNVVIAKLHMRLIWGQLSQSDYFEAPTEIVRPHRFVTGLATVIQPRGLEELEFGLARFFHAPWPDDGIPGRYLTRAFEGFIKERLRPVADPVLGDDRSRDGENQLASMFARLVLPRAGFEFYTEFGREDHSWDLRDLLLLPDWLASLTIGARKSWQPNSDRIIVARGEMINFQLSNASRERGIPSTYVHSSGSNQGHTQRGQLLGAPVGVGSAAGSVFGLDVIHRPGQWTIEWRRTLRQERLSIWPPAADQRVSPDVMHTLSIERTWFRRNVDLRAAFAGSYNFNRNFGSDAHNMAIVFSSTGLPW